MSPLTTKEQKLWLERGIINLPNRQNQVTKPKIPMNLQLFGLVLMVLEFVGALLIICYAFQEQDRKDKQKKHKVKY